jgi:hypothetical protein
MHRVVLPTLLLLAVPSAAHAEVTILSADVASEVLVAPDREFPCETLPWVDPDASLPTLVFYQVIGATGPIQVRRSGSAAEVWSESAPAAEPESGGTLEAEASWADVRIQSGTAIGRSLTPEPSTDVVLRDADGSAGQYFHYDPVTLAFEIGGGDCLEADDSGLRAVPCTGGPRQQWVVDREGRLRGNACEGEWACLVTPGLEDGVAPYLRPCPGEWTLPEQTWAVERWNDPVDSEALLDGLSEVQLPFTYWPVVAVEGSAVPIVLANDGRPIVVAGSAGLGRVAAFGTWQSVCGVTSNQSFETLLQRVLRWAGRSSSPIIGLSPEAISQQSCFSQLGFTTVQTTPDDLDGVDVYVMRWGDDGAPASDVAHLEDFLRGGGGLLASHHVFFYWDVQQYPPTDNLIARVFARAGVAWSEDLDDAASGGSTVDLAGDPPAERAYQITAAFEAFTRHQLGIETLTPEELSAIEANMPVAVTARTLLTDVSPFTVAQRALERITGPVLVGPAQPFTWGQDTLADMALRGDYVLAEALPPDRTPAHESAALFPGLVAPAVPRVTRTVTIDGDVPSSSHEMWRSTGLYAPPGEAVTVRFPPSAPGTGVHLQIGASFDHVMPHVGWLEPNTIGRFPWVTAGRLVQSEQIELAEIEGAVETPAVSLGPRGEAVWQADLEDAPLVELQAGNVIITTRSAAVASVNDPVAALTQLDAMIAAEADLVGIDDDHSGGESIPQRLVFDPFEEWGAHSGYPIHMTQSWDVELIDTAVWPDGSGLWGFLHEFGHNHQQGMWTLSHQGEVTCNILAVYAFETVLGLPMSEAWGGNLEPATMYQRTQDWLNSGQPYSTQGYDVGLYFFLYVKESFGWQPFRTMYAEYRALPPGEQPQTEQEKIDQLAVRLSNATGHNLEPWFRTFRFPLSDWVPREVDHLPPWDTAPF